MQCHGGNWIKKRIEGEERGGGERTVEGEHGKPSYPKRNFKKKSSLGKEEKKTSVQDAAPEKRQREGRRTKYTEENEKYDKRARKHGECVSTPSSRRIWTRRKETRRSSDDKEVGEQRGINPQNILYSTRGAERGNKSMTQ